ncbi:GNAT family N-acetyltransferase [Cytobacillus sp. Hm23]
MIAVKQVNPEDTYEIRNEVLRPHQTIGACKYEHDHHHQSFHLGAFVNNRIVSVASFYNECHPLIDGHIQYRLRGMATLKKYRKKSAGSSLINYAEALMNEKNVDSWWCNARVSVCDYYEKLGLLPQGDIFEIYPIGAHKLMYKVF